MGDFELYLERYSKSRGCSVEEAKEHALVKEVEKQYKENEKEVVTR